jgi:hypothetical protein
MAELPRAGVVSTGRGSVRIDRERALDTRDDIA